MVLLVPAVIVRALFWVTPQRLSVGFMFSFVWLRHMGPLVLTALQKPCGEAALGGCDR